MCIRDSNIAAGFQLITLKWINKTTCRMINGFHLCVELVYWYGLSTHECFVNSSHSYDLMFVQHRSMWCDCLCQQIPLWSSYAGIFTFLLLCHFFFTQLRIHYFLFQVGYIFLVHSRKLRAHNRHMNAVRNWGFQESIHLRIFSYMKKKTNGPVT